MSDEAVDVYAAGTQLAGTMCWICQTRIIAGDEVVFCPHDKLPSHVTCWEHNDGCPVFGCASAPDYGRVSAQALVSQTGEANYRCPSCRKMTKPNLLQCSSCGTPIALESVMNNLEYEDLQFKVKEDLRQHRPVWICLGVSCCLVLAPIMLGVLAMVRWRGTFGPLRLNHMLRETRVVFDCAMAMSLIQTIVLMSFLGTFT